MSSSQKLIQLIQCWIIRKNKLYPIINFFVSFLKQNSSLYQFYFFHFLNQHDSLCIHVLPYHWFNSSRWLLSFSSIEQILLNLITCPHAIDTLYTLRWHDCALRCWCVSFGLQYKSVSNLLQTFVTVAPKKLISVIE